MLLPEGYSEPCEVLAERFLHRRGPIEEPRTILAMQTSERRLLPRNLHGPFLRREKEQGERWPKHQVVADVWQRNWERVIPFFQFPEEIRKII